MNDAEGAIVTGRRRERRVRVVDGFNALGSGFAQFETAQGPGVVTGIPIECYKFVQGATTWRFTSSDRNQTLTDGTFTPEPITRDAQDFSQEDTAQNVAVKVRRDNAVAQLFRSFNPPTPVTLTIYRKHRSATEETVWFVGKVMSCSFVGPEATLACAPISQAFVRRVPSVVFQSQCNWSLYSTPCGVSKASFKTTGTALSVSGAMVRATAFGAKPDGWFNNGWAELPNGERRFIVAHIGDAITLQTSIPSLVVGGTVDAYAGCDRSETTCAAKFSNLANHMGFPRVPTRNPYDGSII